MQGENKKSLYNRYVLVAAVLASIALGYRPADAATVAGDSEVQISGGAGAVGKRPTKLYRAAASAFARHGRVGQDSTAFPKAILTI
jgi:hypothetical protein